MSPSNSQQDLGFSAVATKTIPLRIWFLLYCIERTQQTAHEVAGGKPRTQRALHAANCLQQPASPGPTDAEHVPLQHRPLAYGRQCHKIHRLYRLSCDIYSLHEQCLSADLSLLYTYMPATVSLPSPPFPYSSLPSLPSQLPVQDGRCTELYVTASTQICLILHTFFRAKDAVCPPRTSETGRRFR